MNLVYEVGYGWPQIQQVMLSGACWWSVVYAKSWLIEKRTSAYNFAASVVCGTYVFFDRQKDYIYCVARQAAKEREPRINDYDRSLMIGLLCAVTEEAVRSRIEEVCSDESKKSPPIYDATLQVSENYVQLAFSQGLKLKVGDCRALKPLMLSGNCTEEDAIAKLRSGNAMLADNLIRFISFSFEGAANDSRARADMDSQFVGESRLDEGQFVLERLQQLAPFSSYEQEG